MEGEKEKFMQHCLVALATLPKHPANAPSQVGELSVGLAGFLSAPLPISLPEEEGAKAVSL